MRGTTRRQLLMWREWLSDEWNRPDRTDHYLMQTAFYLASAKKGHRKKLDNFRINFRKKRRVLKKHAEEEAPEHTTAEPMIAMLGGNATRNKISKAEAARIEKLPLAEAATERRRLAKEAKERGER